MAVKQVVSPGAQPGAALGVAVAATAAIARALAGQTDVAAADVAARADRQPANPGKVAAVVALTIAVGPAGVADGALVAARPRLLVAALAARTAAVSAVTLAGQAASSRHAIDTGDVSRPRVAARGAAPPGFGDAARVEAARVAVAVRLAHLRAPVVDAQLVATIGALSASVAERGRTGSLVGTVRALGRTARQRAQAQRQRDSRDREAHRQSSLSH